MSAGSLTALTVGQAIVFGGDRVTYVGADLAAEFQPGDRLLVDQATGELFRVPAQERAVAVHAVDAAHAAFQALSECTDDQITGFFECFAELLSRRDVVDATADANAADVASARRRGRSTTRLELTPPMLSDMIDGLRGWATSPLRRNDDVVTVSHPGWQVSTRRAPLGVVGFVFEGRPNVFADAVGVLRTGNTVVFRIGSDALGTAESIMHLGVAPALRESGLPEGSASLVRSPAHAAGWALFSDTRLALAVAHGSGQAVAQLGGIARQAGIPVSLHGTGGAWMIVDGDADRDRFAACVANSLDRKVCNTLNVCCIVEQRASELVPAFLDAVVTAAAGRNTEARVHATPEALAFIPQPFLGASSLIRRADGEHREQLVSTIDAGDLGHEWEWEHSPEVSLHVVGSIAEAVALHNTLSPRFVVSLISESREAHDRFFAAVDAPFVGDGFTRWVDGQYALDTPELGLSNWEGGRLLARGAILSGDGVHTVRYRAAISDPDLHR